MPQFSDDLFLGSAQGFQGTGVYPNSTTFTGSIATTTLTVTAMLSGDPITVGMYLSGAQVATANAYITAFATGSGGTGTYTISASQTSSSATIVGAGNAYLNDPTSMDLGVGPMGRFYLFDVVPQTLNTSNVCASQTATASGALVLTAGTNAKSVINAAGTTVIQLDCPRALKVNCSTTARAFTVSGFDIYGQAMSEIITVAIAATAVAGLKAFYQISGVTIAGSATACVVGTTDAIGLPVRCIDAGYIARAGWNNTLAENAGTFVAAATATATTTTGDVRGTYTPSSATDGIKRLVMAIGLPGIASGPNATRTGAFGVTQA